MEGGLFPPWKNGSWHGLESEDLQENDQLKLMSSLPAIPEPPTPLEPMEFLSSPSDTLPEAISAPQLAPGKIIPSGNCRRMGTIGKWLHQKQHGNTNMTVKKKDRARLENARLHSALSIAGLASALAAVAAAEDPAGGSHSKLDVALASATKLLASYCVEMAEVAGADHDRVASTVRSAVDIQTPGDLMTLTAAAATALRGEAALRARLPKEAKKNASISPYDRAVAESLWLPAIEGQVWDRQPPCVGDLLQLTEKVIANHHVIGIYSNESSVLRWKHVTIYINKKCQVKIKIKSKHVGGAFSKKNKCVVYGVCDKDGAWPYRKEREASEELYFGLKTAQGLLEFKCESNLHKQKWVDGIESLLRQVNSAEPTERSLEFLNMSTSI
ncbi:Pleckstrin-like, plant [Sesbania bispinosa]|nr:Pleckstrin-like, plant [Sesbania bispinosa]